MTPAVARQMAFSEYRPLFERAIADGIKANLASRTLLATLTEIRRDGADTDKIPDDAILSVLEVSHRQWKRQRIWFRRAP